MKRLKQRWYLITIVLATLVIPTIAVAPFKKVSIATSTTAATTATTASTISTETSTAAAEGTKSENITAAGPTKNSKLTGIPQIDYIWDPNLPRELRGYNLSSYPFFSTVPPEEDIHFKCDGLHDGFYASIEHHCQLYHHCVYGIRHDFLCANFTAFDQKTFICHFASDVDCEGSEKYWNRNDALYMATTTTSTTTTTTEPPPTPRRRLNRPQRPLRRPHHRRPDDEYYYDDEESAYDDDYFEERVNARRKQRPRHRKPQLDYDDEHEEKRALSDDEAPRRHNSRDRHRGGASDNSEAELGDDYEIERPKIERPKARNKSQLPAERRKSGARRPIAVSGRSGADERRAFAGGDEKPKKVRTETTENVGLVSSRRNPVGRRRFNEKRPIQTAAPATDAADDSDYDEKPHAAAADDGSVAAGSQEGVDDGSNDSGAAVKTKPKPLEEFVTPKAPGASVYARPRAPPRIARPVPVSAKKKFEYPVQKSQTATTVAPTAASPEYDEYDDYAEPAAPAARPRAPGGRRRAEDDVVAEAPLNGRRRKPNRHTLRRPLTDKKSYLAAAADDDDEYEVSSERYEAQPVHAVSGRKRPYSQRARLPARGGGDDVDFVDDDYDDGAVATPAPPRKSPRLRQKNLARKNSAAGKLRPQAYADEDLYEDEAPTVEVPAARKRLNENFAGGGVGRSRSKQRSHITAAASTEAATAQSDVEAEDELSADAVAPSSSSSKSNHERPARPAAVRVVKRPFLPSRGGSPYLPRGLQPVGIAHRALVGNALATGVGSQTTDSTPIDMGSTISGVRLLEHGAPILRDSGREHNSYINDMSSSQQQQSQQQQSQPIKATLDELYETDYDVTLNDALNPTLKPLSPLPHHHQYHQNQQHIHQQQQQLSNRNYASAYALSNSQGSATNHNHQHQHHKNNQTTALQYQHHQQQNDSNNDNDDVDVDVDDNNNDDDNNDNQQHQHQISYQTLSPMHMQSQSSQSQALLHHHQQQQSPPHHHHHHSNNQQQYQTGLNNFNSDSYFSSTDIRRRAIVIPSSSKGHTSHTATAQQQYRGVGTRIAQHFYDDFDY